MRKTQGPSSSLGMTEEAWASLVETRLLALQHNPVVKLLGGAGVVSIQF